MDANVVKKYGLLETIGYTVFGIVVLIGALSNLLTFTMIDVYMIQPLIGNHVALSFTFKMVGMALFFGVLLSIATFDTTGTGQQTI